jgi:hypothetical protein
LLYMSDSSSGGSTPFTLFRFCSAVMLLASGASLQ